jgi:hypothetical protein
MVGGVGRQQGTRLNIGSRTGGGLDPGTLNSRTLTFGIRHGKIR